MAMSTRALTLGLKRPRAIWIAALLVTACVGSSPRSVAAATIVITNQTEKRVSFRMSPVVGHSGTFHLEPRTLVALPVTGSVECLADRKGQKPARYTLHPNGVFFFTPGPDEVPELRQVAFEGVDRPVASGPSPGTAGRVDFKRLGKPGVVRVKILVDEDEVRLAKVWKETLRKRIAAASAILEQTCRMRLEIIAEDVWSSNDQFDQFRLSLREFEREAFPGTAQLVLGFTSQYPLRRKKVRLGGTGGPLQAHILMREHGPGIRESDRLEVLLHELGHFFGAAHSDNPDSLMRPILGDGRAHRRNVRMAYDPINTLAMNVLAEEWRMRNVRHLRHVRPEVQAELATIYRWLIKTQPKDPAARDLLALLESSSDEPPAHAKKATPKVRGETPLDRGVARIVAAIVAAREKDPPKPNTKPNDATTTAAIRAAAQAAERLPRDVSVEAFVTGLAIALGQNDQYGRLSPVVRRFLDTESVADRQSRIRIVGAATMRGRHDLLQHFMAVGLMTLKMGAAGAESIGMLKEMHDADGGSGFSFADVAANFAGARFVTGLRDGSLTLKTIQQEFSVTRFVPRIEGLEEGIPIADFRKRYESPQSKAFQSQIDKIRLRIARLPAYRR